MHEPVTSSLHPAIVLLHGAGGNIGFWFDRLTPALASAGVALYAPHYFDRTGTVRADPATIADGIHVPRWLSTVDDAIAFAASRPNVDPARVALVGISLGAFLSLALAAQLSGSDSGRIRAIVELSGGLVEPYNSQATASFPPTLILHGQADEVVPISHAHALGHRLQTLGVPHQIRTLANEGHWFSGPAQMQLLIAVASFLSANL